MSSKINEPPRPPEQHQENNKVTPKRDNGKNHLTPNSREVWAEVLATADRYY